MAKVNQNNYFIMDIEENSFVHFRYLYGQDILIFEII